MRALVIAAILFVPASVCALEIGARLPIKYGEIFMVRNDGGIKNGTTHFEGAPMPGMTRHSA